MSYILEALKKAQAERQLGATPTIHAPTLDGGAGVARGTAMKKPLVIAVGVMAAAIVALLVVVFRQQASAPPPAAQQSTPAPLATAVQQTPAIVPPPVVQQTAPVPATPPAAPVAVSQAPRAPAPAEPAKASAAAPDSKPAVAESPAAPAPPAPAAQAEVQVVPAQPEVTQTLRDLPEPIQRAIPQITFGGYMYSKNPADRMVLIDKILRKEGEEVAPGLVLEKLLPKAAVFSFRGYRYRVSL